MFRLLFAGISAYGIYWSLPVCAAGNAQWHHWAALLTSLWVFTWRPEREASVKALVLMGLSGYGIYWALPQCVSGNPESYHWFVLLTSIWVFNWYPVQEEKEVRVVYRDNPGTAGAPVLR